MIVVLYIALYILLLIYPIILVCIGIFAGSPYESVDWLRWITVGLGIIFSVLIYSFLYKEYKKGRKGRGLHLPRLGEDNE